MRFLLFTSFVIVYVCGIAQVAMDRHVNLQTTGSVEHILASVEEQTRVRFMYEDRIINLDSVVTVDIVDEELRDVLKILFPSQDILITPVGNQIIIHKKKNRTPVRKQAPPKNKSKNQKIELVYDTINLIIFDTLVTNITDTTMVVVYDTVVRTLEEKNSFSFFVNTSCDIRDEMFRQKADSATNIRIKSESALPGFSLQAIGLWDISKFRLGTGITYRQMFTRYNYDLSQTTNTQQTAILTISDSHYEYFLSGDYIVTSFGDSVFVRYVDSVLVEQDLTQTITQQETEVKTYTRTGISSVGLLGIPVVFSYPVPINRKCTALFGVTSEVDFRLFHNELTVQETTGGLNLNSQFSVKDLFWFVSVDAGIEYKIKRHMSLISTFRLMYSKQDYYNNDSGNNSRMIYSVGIGLLFR